MDSFKIFEKLLINIKILIVKILYEDSKPKDYLIEMIKAGKIHSITVEDFRNEGIKEVNEGNLEMIKKVLVASGEITTIEQIQEIVTETIKNLQSLDIVNALITDVALDKKDTNLLTVLNAIKGVSDSGVTLSIKEEVTGNKEEATAKIGKDGSITRGTSEQVLNVVITLSKGRVVTMEKTIKVTIPKADTVVFQAELDKTEYGLDDKITLSGSVLKGENGISNTNITILVVTEDGESIITMDQVVTKEDGTFTYSFKVPKNTEVGKYKVKVQANEDVNQRKELELTMVKPKIQVEVAFNYTEYTIAPKGYVPSKGDLILTTTGLKYEEIKSVKITSTDTSVLTVTQRPEYAAGGFPKSKTRAFGKGIKVGKASIIAVVTDINGNEYRAECKVTVTN